MYLLTKSAKYKIWHLIEKDKSKIFIFSQVINRNDSAYHLPYVSYTKR